MNFDPEQPAQNPFWFRECFLMPMPIGKKAINLRELLEILREADESVFYYHLLQYRLAISHQVVEYPNDFALWAALALQDSKLAEKLSSFDPLEYDNMAQVQVAILDILEEYLWDLPYVPWARPGFEFHFCRASMAVIQIDPPARTLREFCQTLQRVGLDSLYYHFFEAQRRFGMHNVDDFSYWIETNFGLPGLVAAIRNLDIYFYNLKEIRDSLLDLIHQHLEDICGYSK